MLQNAVNAVQSASESTRTNYILYSSEREERKEDESAIIEVLYIEMMFHILVGVIRF